MPSVTPIAPPAIESVSASIRNCVRMSRPLAPIAMRIPISRVRSVTDTSMMFMIPIPPTRSEIDAAEASSERERLGGLVGRLRDLLLRADHEVRVLPGPIRWRWRSSASISCCASPTASRETAEAMNMSIFVGLLEEPHDRRVRGDDDVVLVLPHRAAALGLEDADDAEREVLDPHGLADRVLALEEGVRHGRAEHATLAAARTSDSPKKTPRSTFHERMNGQSTPTPWTLRAPVQVARDDLGGRAGHRRHVGDRRALRADGRDVLLGDRGLPGEDARPGLRRHAREDHEEVRAEGRDLRLDGGLGALAHADHRDDAGHADDDAERRQHRAHLVARDRLQARP